MLVVLCKTLCKVPDSSFVTHFNPECVQDLRTLLNIPSNYHVLFFQGGAHGQVKIPSQFNDLEVLGRSVESFVFSKRVR